MYCSDFEFDGEMLSDHGFVIGGDEGESDSWSGGEITFTTIKPPYQNRNNYYTYSYDAPLVMTFPIMKNPCENEAQEDMYLTQDEQSYIMRWLHRQDGYHWLKFLQDDYKDVWYNVQFNLQPIEFGGHIIGFTLTGTCDSPYAYSHEYNHDFTLAIGETFDFKNYSDMTGKRFVHSVIVPQGSGKLAIRSGCTEYNVLTTVQNVSANDRIVLDGNNDLITGISDMNTFNFEFPIIANSYNNRTTYFMNQGDMEITMNITFRYIREVRA